MLVSRDIRVRVRVCVCVCVGRHVNKYKKEGWTGDWELNVVLSLGCHKSYSVSKGCRVDFVKEICGERGR